MARNNRVFSCNHTNIVSPEQNYQATFIFFPSLKVKLVLLLFHCDLHPGSSFNTNNTVSCVLCGNTIMFFASLCPCASIARTIIFMTVILLKRLALSYKANSFCVCLFYIGCMTCYTLHTQWSGQSLEKFCSVVM